MFSCDLRKEQKKALIVVVDALSNLNTYLTNQIISEMLPTGYKAFSYDKIYKEELLHGKEWLWHQSYGKVDVMIDARTKVTLSKFNPRKTSKNTQIKTPPYKLWLSTIDFVDLSQPKLYFIWCEKGREDENHLNRHSSTAYNNYVINQNHNNTVNNNNFYIHIDSKEEIDNFVRYIFEMNANEPKLISS